MNGFCSHLCPTRVPREMETSQNPGRDPSETLFLRLNRLYPKETYNSPQYRKSSISSVVNPSASQVSTMALS